VAANKLTTVAELSAELRVPIRWIKAEAEAGRLPHLKVGRRFFFNIDAIRAALAERAANPGAEQCPK